MRTVDLLDHSLLIHAEREFFTGGIALHLAYEIRDSDQISVAQPLTFVEVDRSTLRSDPCARFDHRSAQRLMDELWQCGLRPSEGSGSAGSLAATERHLADMRALAYHALKVPK